MLDLNVDAFFPVESASCDRDDRGGGSKTASDDSVVFTTTSSTYNAVPIAVADEVVDCGSSTRENSLSTFNFSILEKGVIAIEDDVNNEVADGRNEIQLFTMGTPSPSLISARAWLNLSAPVAADSGGVELGIYKAQLTARSQVQQPQVKKSRRGPRSRSSQYRGVTFYRRTGRWESHIWDCGKQVYLGGFDTAHSAARAYDRAAIKFRGVEADLNFTISDYEEDMKQMKNLTKEEFVHILRRQNTGFSRGSSKYKGITLHKFGRWEARMGQFLGKKAHNQAAIKCNRKEAVTNFETCNYEREVIGSKDGGSGSNLNLYIGMYLSSDGPLGNNITRDLQFCHASKELADGRRLKVETASGLHQDFGMSTKCDPMRPAGICSGFGPNV